jgi:hypothetical protein
VAPLAVDNHARREQHPARPLARQRAHAHGRPKIVVGAVAGHVVFIQAQSDSCRPVADELGTTDCAFDEVAVAEITDEVIDVDVRVE